MKNKIINSNNSKLDYINSKISGLQFWKLILIFLLMLSATIVNLMSSNPELLKTDMQRIVLGIIIFEYISIITILIALRKKAKIVSKLFAGQIISDILLTSVLIHFTGGALSPYNVLYLFSVISSALVYSFEVTAIFTTITIFLYVLVSVLGWKGFLPIAEGQILISSEQNLTDLLRKIFLNISASSLVAALSMYLGLQLKSVEIEVKRRAESLKKLKIRHKDVLDSLNDAVVIVHSDGNVIDCNNAFLDLLKQKNKVTNIKSIGIKPQILTQNKLLPFKTDILIKEQTIPVEISINQFKSYENYNVMVIRDLREIEKLRKIAKQNEKMAALGRMASGIAHEIRNPLGSISGSLELLSDNFITEDEDNKELLDIIFSEITRLNNLINQLMDYTREKKYIKVQTDLVKIINQTVKLLQSSPKSKGFLFEIKTPNELIATVDPEAIKQVLSNIIINALDASENKKITILLEETNDKIKFSVIDKGKIIPNNIKNKIFEPFFSEKTNGTGLGLSIASKIVFDHNGILFVEKSDETNTIITFIISNKEQNNV